MNIEYSINGDVNYTIGENDGIDEERRIKRINIKNISPESGIDLVIKDGVLTLDLKNCYKREDVKKDSVITVREFLKTQKDSPVRINAGYIDGENEFSRIRYADYAGFDCIPDFCLDMQFLEYRPAKYIETRMGYREIFPDYKDGIQIDAKYTDDDALLRSGERMTPIFPSEKGD